MREQESDRQDPKREANWTIPSSENFGSTVINIYWVF